LTLTHGTFLVAFGLLTIVFGLVTLLAGSLRDLTRTRRRSFGIGGLLLVFLGSAAAVGNLDNVITLDPDNRQVWFGLVTALYAGAVLTAAILIFIVSSTGRIDQGDLPTRGEVTKGQQEKTRADWRGRRPQPEDLPAGSQVPPDAGASAEGPGKPSASITPGQGRKPPRPSTPAG
jgi:hypothetical protein